MDLPGLRVLAADPPTGGLTSRQAAIDQGIRAARGELVLLTDARCRPPREWIRELTGHMGFRDGAVTSPVIFAGRRGLLGRVQTVHSLVTFTYLRWAHRRRLVHGLAEPSLALRRDAYLEAGGMASVGFAMAPGMPLGKALVRAGWSIRYLTAPTVPKLAAANLKGLVLRMRRRAHHRSRGLTTLLALIIATNLILAVGAIGWGGWWAVALGVRYLVGLLLIAGSLGHYGPLGLGLAAGLYEPVFTLLGAFTYLSLLIRPRWRSGERDFPAPNHKPSPLDIPGIKSSATTDDVLEAVRDSRERPRQH